MCRLLTGAEAEGRTIPEAVPIEGVVRKSKRPPEQPPNRRK
jgi:hypothetical protein